MGWKIRWALSRAYILYHKDTGVCKVKTTFYTVDPLPISRAGKAKWLDASKVHVYIYMDITNYRIKHSYSIVIAKLFEKSVVFSYYSKQLIAAGRQLKSNCILIDFRRIFVM